MTTFKEKITTIPLPLFAIVMGTAGLSIAWKRAEVVVKSSTASSIAEIVALSLYFLAFATFIALLFAYVVRIFTSFDNLRADLHHPIKVTFLSAITIGLMLIATAGMGVVPHMVSTVLWWIAAVGHLCLMLVTMRMWMRTDITVAHVTPAWFIPVVGNVVAPLGGMQLDARAQTMSVFSFSIGIVMWLAILPIVFYRLFAFDKPLPAPFIPTMFILIAPAAVSSVSLMMMEGQPSIASFILFYAAVGFFLIAITRLPELIRLPFNIPHWAMSFPLAAMASAGFVYDKNIGFVFLTLATIVIAGLWVLSLLALARGGFGSTK